MWPCAHWLICSTKLGVPLPVNRGICIRRNTLEDTASITQQLTNTKTIPSQSDWSP